MCFSVAMLSLHTSPLAELGRTRDAGGMNVYVRELARELGDGGIRVDIFTRRVHADQPPIIYISDHVRLIYLPAGPEQPLSSDEILPYVGEFVGRVRRFAERAGKQYDLVHSHYWLSGAAGVQLARAWAVPHVTMYHTVERLKDQPADDAAAQAARTRRIEIERQIATQVDCVTVSTSHEADQLKRLYGLGPEMVRIIPCGVDTRRFTPGSAHERASARRALGICADQPAVLFVGRLDPIKGVDLLLDAIARTQTAAQLVVVGGDPNGDAELDRLRGRARALAIGNRVRFPGAVEQPALLDYYRAADVLAVASHYESFGLVACEALACGTPVVATAVGGLPSIVRDGENGILVRWRSADAFAAQLDRVLGDDSLRARLAARARPSVTRYDWHRIGDRVRMLYHELTSAVRAAEACACF